MEGAHLIFIDGASRGNPGEAAYGVAIYSTGGNLIGEEGRSIGLATNNQAEYGALLRALEMARELGLKNIIIHSDSELLVRQINGIYKVKNPTLKLAHKEAIDLMKGFDSVELMHIAREQNKKADLLANRAIDEGRSRPDDRSRQMAGEESPGSAEQGAG